MLKRKVLLATLFILGISLLNVAVLIEASNQESQLSVDTSEQQPIPTPSSTHTKKKCNGSTGRCSIVDANYTCREYNNRCRDW